MKAAQFILIGLIVVALLMVVTHFQVNTAVEAASVGWAADNAHLRDNGTTTVINDAVSGDSTLVTGTSGRVIFITGLFIQSEGTQNVTLNTFDGTTHTAVTGAIEFADGDSLYLDLESAPITLTSGDSLSITTSASVQINGWVVTAKR